MLRTIFALLLVALLFSGCLFAADIRSIPAPVRDEFLEHREDLIDELPENEGLIDELPDKEAGAGLIDEIETKDETKDESKEDEKDNEVVKIAELKLSSPAFEHNANIPDKYTCKGQNISPPLSITGIPEGTKTLVLIVDDPDAPMGNWDHWILWNIPIVSEIAENSIPSGAVQGTTDFQEAKYGGPCPPSGTHRYFFKLYALDTELGLAAGARKADVESAMQGHILAQTELIGLCSA